MYGVKRCNVVFGISKEKIIRPKWFIIIKNYEVCHFIAQNVLGLTRKSLFCINLKFVIPIL